MRTRIMFVMGGVLSGVGKGTATSSIGKILQWRGFSVSAVKIDPYLNVDAGTMNPTEHGEVFVTADGTETDQDLGNYERFLDVTLSGAHSITQGSVWQTVIQKERSLQYGGKCVEVIPHITDEVTKRILSAARRTKARFLLVEVGGTVGEYQNALFLEAARRMRLRFPDRILFIIVSYLPIPRKLGEMKTKPTQTAVRQLNEAGIQPDFIIARSERELDQKRKEKLSLFCNVAPDDVISSPDVENIYAIPLVYRAQKLDERILRKCGMRGKHRLAEVREWERRLVMPSRATMRPVRIAIVGKYFSTGDYTLSDSYISVLEALKHAAYARGVVPELTWIDSEDFEKGRLSPETLNRYHGIVVPGGFGSRGIDGILAAIRFAREHRLPFFGLCYGMQLMTIEFARNAAGLTGAHTTEVDPTTPHPVIDLMLEQKAKLAQFRYGGTMRLGAFPCTLKRGTLAHRAYGTTNIVERHRHRYEFNNAYRKRLEKAGLRIAGWHPATKLVEIVELAEQPFFLGTQFHPEFTSRPLRPHPLYQAFLEATLRRL